MRLDLAEVGIRAVSNWIFNCWLIEDGGAGGAVVVDAGLPSNTREVLALLSDDLGRRAQDVALVVATHAHTDHVGGVPDLLEAADVPLCLPRRVEAYAAGERPRSPDLAALARIWPVMLDQPFRTSGLRELAALARTIGYSREPYRMPVSPSGWLDDGASLPNAPDWEVLGTPGHTDDSTCFYNARARVLLSGDTILTAGGRAWFNPEYVDRELSGETEARLRNLRVDVLLPGHGRPLAGHDLLTDALSCTDRMPDRLRFAAGALADMLSFR